MYNAYESVDDEEACWDIWKASLFFFKLFSENLLEDLSFFFSKPLYRRDLSLQLIQALDLMENKLLLLIAKDPS